MSSHKNLMAVLAITVYSLTMLTACPSSQGVPDLTVVKVTPRVLMVVANDGFFFQEYFDPRRELETAGLQVFVASGLGGTATPHLGSYHNHKNPANDYPDGIVPLEENRTIPSTLVLSQQAANNYDALVIVGGWGAARYYFSYPGELDGSVSAFAPNTQEALEMNRLIGEFLSAQKPVMGVCNGVNVLSWARIDGKSPLDGVSISVPWGSAFPQSYPNPYPSGNLTAYTANWTIDGACSNVPTADCFSMEKFATDNGALIRDDSTRTDPQSHARDLVFTEAGLIFTVQDNFAARAAGQRFAQRLLN